MSKELSTLGSVIKTAYEGEDNTNAFTDAEKTALAAALSAADINTLAELNALIDDATLGDSGDFATAGHAHEGTEILSAGPVTDGFVLTADGAGGAAWEEASGGGAFSADAQTQITPSTPIVLDEETGDEVALELSYTTNKATSGNDTGLLINQTDTASPGTSLPLDIQVGGTSKLFANNAGQIVGATSIATPTVAASAVVLNSGFGFRGNVPAISVNGTSNTEFTNGVRIGSAMSLQWTASSGADAAADTYLKRDAAGILRVTDSGGTAGGSLKLDLTTEDRGFINFAGTADGDTTSAISTLTTSGAITHHIQVEINGTKAWIPCSTNAPS